MIGRREQLERIERLLGAARRDRAGALVIVGEAGMGKTSLLQAAERAAQDFRVLRARGVESEALLGHAGLLQLLGPVRHHMNRLPGPSVERWSPQSAGGKARATTTVTWSQPGLSPCSRSRSRRHHCS